MEVTDSVAGEAILSKWRGCMLVRSDVDGVEGGIWQCCAEKKAPMVAVLTRGAEGVNSMLFLLQMLELDLTE